MESESVALVAKALLEIADPVTDRDTIWLTKPGFRDTVCANILLDNTILKAKTADVQEIVRLVQKMVDRLPGFEDWYENILRTDRGYCKLKGLLWLNMKYRQ